MRTYGILTMSPQILLFQAPLREMPWEASLSPQASCSSLTCWHWASPWGHTSLSFPTMCTDIVSNKSNTFHSTPTCSGLQSLAARAIPPWGCYVQSLEKSIPMLKGREEKRKSTFYEWRTDERMGGRNWVDWGPIILSPVCEQHNANYVSFPLLRLFGLSPSGLSRKCELLELLHTQGRRKLF